MLYYIWIAVDYGILEYYNLLLHCVENIVAMANIL